jgi:integrase
MASARYMGRGRSVAAGHARRKTAERESIPARAKPRRLRNRTINIEISMIWTALNKAVEWGLIDENPVSSTKGLRLPERDSREFRALTELEFERFRGVCPAWLLPPLMAAALLGLRNAEVRYLEWSDVDFDARVIRVRNKDGFELKSQGHTGIREFRMNIPRALEEILRLLHEQRGAYKDDLVFHNSLGRQFSKDALRRAFANVMKECAIKDVTQVHALRKTFITHMAKREKNVFILQELARHRNIQTTRRYVNVFEEDKRQAMDGFDIGRRVEAS